MAIRGNVERTAGECGRNCSTRILVFVRDAKNGERRSRISAEWKLGAGSDGPGDRWRVAGRNDHSSGDMGAGIFCGGRRGTTVRGGVCGDRSGYASFGDGGLDGWDVSSEGETGGRGPGEKCPIICHGNERAAIGIESKGYCG